VYQSPVPPQVETALREIENGAFYLRFDRDHGRYFASLQPSINRALAEIREGLRDNDPAVKQLLAVTARKVIASDNGLFKVDSDVAGPRPYQGQRQPAGSRHGIA
jgi:hypothetical protein